MNIVIQCSLVVATLSAVNGLSMAQDSTAKVPVTRSEPVGEVTAEDNIRNLPSPFSEVRTNILDLEQSGYFVVDEVDFRTRGNGDEAIVWMIRVKKPVTCRHIQSLLREYRDARFYSTLSETRLKVLATLAHYSDRIKLGSSSNLLLRQDDVFEFWIDLPEVEFRKLLSLNADTLVLRRWRY